MRSTNTLGNLFNRTLEWLLVILMSALVFNVIWQVASRYLFNSPSSYTEEIARFLLIWIGFLGATYAFGKHSHLGLDLCTRYLDTSTRRVVYCLAQVMVLLFSAIVMLFGGVKLVMLILSLKQLSPALQLPMGYIYLAVPVSGLLISLYCVESLITGQQKVVQ